MASKILKIGLHLVGYKKRRIRQAKKKASLDCFRAHSGSNPNILAEILEDLQTAAVEEAKVTAAGLSIKYFLMAMHAPSQKVSYLVAWKSNRRQCLTFPICGTRLVLVLH
jgi:hypothetical protein